MLKNRTALRRGDRAVLITTIKETIMNEDKKVVTKQDIQDWYDSGPIKPDILQMWLDIIQKDKETK